ncbi:hypothetical protein GLOIN_2v1521895 [Rhizophagus irregularis DAOM 181602=DAOM 197198]|uniref:Uncharacterized protein n=1 Tax=Rhizophagus irregularis (strain DAOM 181602 / DAOM 197198 / MUCL 43194) TaxID=747089 RepID=A0A2P4QR71_RHIID|nr:hypothetical protein GLOIN_2v1521895 [Rhizophagus irregularis DAOM 181602=DAOM 197198]POG80143.1 hypothetical protein GLOIN_2v1521895 [Rhizophagus irregularis DAOM 181602=DAOM 197198]|eukprot:XP_025187009.1 hypothetical protein GLOIN_2v1521895 [Rhizophagus irregularis DAOM 181602=DAOM 197198]
MFTMSFYHYIIILIYYYILIIYNHIYLFLHKQKLFLIVLPFNTIFLSYYIIYFLHI